MRDSKRETDVLNSLLDSMGEGEGGMIRENGIETCKLSYVKQIASLGSMHDSGCSECMIQGWWTESTFSAVNFLKPRYLSSNDSEHLASKLRCAVSVKYTLDSKDLVWMKGCETPQ